jgi:hypothetical protein
VRQWPLAARLSALSAGLIALAASAASFSQKSPPVIVLGVAAAFALAAVAAAAPLRAFPAYGLLMTGLVTAAAASYVAASQLTLHAGIALATLGAIALGLAAWPGPQAPDSSPPDRFSAAPPSSSS